MKGRNEEKKRARGSREGLTIGCANEDRENWSWAACEVSCLGV